MSIVRHATLLCFLLLSAATFSFGQSNKTYTANFRVYGLNPGDYTNILAVDAQGRPRGIQFKRKQRSDLYSVTLTTESQSIFFFRKSTSPELPNALIGQIAIPASSAEWLLVFTKTNNSDSTSDQFIIRSISDDLSDFPAGSIRIVNFTETPLSRDTNGTRFTLEPDQSTKSIDSKAHNKAEITIVVEGRSRYHLAYKNEIAIDSSSRALLMLRPPARTGSVRIGGHLLKDTPSPSKHTGSRKIKDLQVRQACLTYDTSA